jgi:hypothetical protein
MGEMIIREFTRKTWEDRDNVADLKEVLMLMLHPTSPFEGERLATV